MRAEHYTRAPRLQGDTGTCPRKDGALQEEHRGYHGHRRKGDVHLHGPQRRLGHLEARGHGGCGACLLAGLVLREGEGEQALHHGAHVPSREAPEGQVQAVLPDGRGGLRRCRADRRRRAYLDDPPHSGWVELLGLCHRDQQRGLQGMPQRFQAGPRDVPPRTGKRGSARIAWAGSKETPFVSSTARYLNATRSSGMPRCFSTTCAGNAETISTNASTRSRALVFPSP